ncbi:MAG: dephospho-CoA kinase [Clostridiales bacterium]|nr:dephospho-CoA kinase [Clostridiales bacterium]
MIIVGITGNSGCGKSTVCDYLKNMGAYVIDADKLARDITEPYGLAYNDIISEFGEEILTDKGFIDRKKLAALIFSSKEKQLKLQDITHGHILKAMLNEAHSIGEKVKNAVVIFDAPLLFESGLNKKCDWVWVVDSDYENKIARIMNRDSLTETEAKRRLNSQTDPEILKKKADGVIMNNGTEAELYRKTEIMFKEIILTAL